MRNDSTLFSQLRPELLRKAEVGHPVAVQVADLPAAELEAQLAQVAGCRMNAWPGRDLSRDLISCGPCVRHELSLPRIRFDRSNRPCLLARSRGSPRARSARCGSPARAPAPGQRGGRGTGA